MSETKKRPSVANKKRWENYRIREQVSLSDDIFEDLVKQYVRCEIETQDLFGYESKYTLDEVFTKVIGYCEEMPIYDDDRKRLEDALKRLGLHDRIVDNDPSARSTSFYHYVLSVAKAHNNPRGDFINDARDDKKFPHTNDWCRIETYLRRKGACFEAVEAGKEVYSSWLAWKRSRSSDQVKEL